MRAHLATRRAAPDRPVLRARTTDPRHARSRAERRVCARRGEGHRFRGVI